MERFVLRDDVDETLGARRLIAIDQQRRHVCHLGCFEGVTKDKSENGRQNEQQNKDATVAVDVQKFLVSDAGDCVERGRFHKVDLRPFLPTAFRMPRQELE